MSSKSEHVGGAHLPEMRDRWFHGIHVHASPPASGEQGVVETSHVTTSTSNGNELATLASLDVYGTLDEKHVRLTRGAVRLMYADVRERTGRVLVGRCKLDPDLKAPWFLQQQSSTLEEEKPCFELEPGF